MVECGHLGPQKNKHGVPHQLIPLTQVIPMQAFLNNCWEIMQLAPLQAKLEIWSCLFQKCYKQLLRLEYSSDIPQTSGRTPDVQLHVMDVAFCVVGHLTPNLAECSNVFLFLLWLKYCGHPTLHNGHGVFSLLDNLCPIRQSVFPFITSHLSFFQIYFHSYLAYLISDISWGTCI